MGFFMVVVVACLGSLCIGLGIGYAVGWNRAKHPGKVEGIVGRAADSISDKVKG